MSSGDEIMMPIPKPEAVSMAEIHALRGLTDAVGTLTRQVERMNEKVDDVRERVIRIEAKNHERQIEALQAALAAAAGRIDALEGTRDKQAGAISATGWLAKYTPWIFGLAMAALAGMGFERGQP